MQCSILALPARCNSTPRLGDHHSKRYKRPTKDDRLRVPNYDHLNWQLKPFNAVSPPTLLMLQSHSPFSKICFPIFADTIRTWGFKHHAHVRPRCGMYQSNEIGKCTKLNEARIRIDQSVNSSSIEPILYQSLFSYFVCLVKSPSSEGNNVICDIKTAYHVEKSLPDKFILLI